MKTLFVSLAALAAVSSAALASDRSYDLRDSDTYFGKFSNLNNAKTYATESNALGVINDGKTKETAFERMMRISEENEHGGKDNGAGRGDQI